MISSFQLLQNEGCLMQNCLKSSLAALRKWRIEDRGAFYGAFFGFTIGLERLLKIIILFDSWCRCRKFLTDSELKAYCHNLQKLHASVNGLFEQYGVPRQDNLEPDEIDKLLLQFLSSFAQRNRYYNLYTLTKDDATDPLGEWEDLLRNIYEKDIPKDKHLPEPDENCILADHIEGNACIKFIRTGSTLETTTEHNYDQMKMALALPEMCWRLVKILAPLQFLLIAIQEKIREKDADSDENPTIPYMEEFLEFVCAAKNIMANSEDWP
jgi:hypothetical protein